MAGQTLEAPHCAFRQVNRILIVETQERLNPAWFPLTWHRSVSLVETDVREALNHLRDDLNTGVKNQHLLDILKHCMQAFFTLKDLQYEQAKMTLIRSLISGYITEMDRYKLEATTSETLNL